MQGQDTSSPKVGCARKLLAYGLCWLAARIQLLAAHVLPEGHVYRTFLESVDNAMAGTAQRGLDLYV